MPVNIRELLRYLHFLKINKAQNAGEYIRTYALTARNKI